MNKFALILKKTLLMAAIPAFLTFTSCSDDDEPEVEQIETSDPAAVTSAITIPNATVKSGNIPAQSTAAGAPVLTPDNDDVYMIQGGKMAFYPELKTGDAAGFYVQVNGATSYFDVTSTTVTQGRAKFGRAATSRKNESENGRTKDTTPGFSITIPENLGKGEFCIKYAVYDAQKRVSNTIEICITVKELGGANSAFITGNAWQLVSTFTAFPGDPGETELVGQTYTSTYSTMVFCETNYKEVSVTETERTDYNYITFSTNGTLRLEGQGFYKYMDSEASNASCAVVYKEETEKYTHEGAWTYDDSAKKLILIYDVNFTYEDQNGKTVTETETNTEEYSVAQSGGNLVLTAVPHPGIDETFIVTIKAK